MRKITVPVRWIVVLAFAAVSGPILSIYASVQIAQRNSAALIEKYEADRSAQRAETKRLSCALFSSQLGAFDNAESPTGQQSRQAWLDLYRLAQCEPRR